MVEAVEGEEALLRAAHEGYVREERIHVARPLQVEVFGQHHHLEVVGQDAHQHCLRLVPLRRVQQGA